MNQVKKVSLLNLKFIHIKWGEKTNKTLDQTDNTKMPMILT